MNDKVYFWDRKHNDFAEIIGVTNHWLLGKCYKITHRDKKVIELFEIDRNPLLVGEDVVTRHRTKKLVKKFRLSRNLTTLPSGDQPSLLIED